MSARSTIGILFLLAAILSPWLVSDWLPEGFDEPNRTFETREWGSEKNATSGNGDVPPLANQKTQKRHLPKAVKKPFATSARVLSNSYRSTPRVPENQLTRRTNLKHRNRIQSELSAMGLQLGNPVFCRIFKEEKELELWLKPDHREEFHLFRVYRITHYAGSPGPKREQGDRQAPEGFYYIPPSRLFAEGRFHMGFDLGYPNQFDSYHNRTGGKAFVNGEKIAPNSFSLNNESIEEIFVMISESAQQGQKFFRVHSFPFRMDDKTMDPSIIKNPRNQQFWGNLKEGYDFFEVLRLPPNVTVSSEGIYQFSLPPTSQP